MYHVIHQSYVSCENIIFRPFSIASSQVDILKNGREVKRLKECVLALREERSDVIQSYDKNHLFK